MKALQFFVSALVMSAVPMFAAADGRAVTVTGCLQEGNNHNDYILTHLNEPPVPTATAGKGRPHAVERDDLQEARNAYRLEADKKLRLNRYLGQEVRVAGTVVTPTHVPSSSAATGATTPPKITESELAALQVSSVKRVRKACGSGRSR